MPRALGMLVLVGLFCLIIGLFWHVRIPQGCIRIIDIIVIIILYIMGC